MSNPIEYKQFVFGLAAKESLILPTYKGSTIRGGFGYAFKRVVCAIEDKEYPLLILVGYFADAVRIDFGRRKSQTHVNLNFNRH